ncbi:MAG: acyl-CoA thioesterase [Thiotrichaceae bacterium]|nr:acyl-CoA thioesterase [Thiotrichaceae bacterium]
MNTPPLLFKYTFSTRIHDIDAAGVMFFGRFFYHIHNAYESFLNENQSGIARILASDFILPITHTEADFKAPVLLNETLSIDIFLQEKKAREFILYYHLVDSSDNILASALTKHVCVHKVTKKSADLPEMLKFLAVS